MKKMTKFIALMAVWVLVVGSFAACGGGKEERVQTDGKNFTFWCNMDGNSVAAGLTNNGEMMMYQEMEKRTGVHIDFIHPIKGSTGNEAFIAMITAGDLPDLIQYNWEQYTGGPQQALDDGVVIALNDYIKDYAPNFYDYMEGEKGKENNYLWKLQGTTEDGRYFGFNVLNIGTTKGFAGLYVRADKLKAWGMEIPETIDEWTAFFAKAKAEGFSKPFTCSLDVLSFKSAVTHSFNTAFDVGKGLYLEGDEVVFGPFQPGYKEYTAQIAEWVKAGYIDSGFVTNDATKIEGNMANDISAASYGYIGSGIGKILPAAQANNPDFDVVACPYPVAEKGTLSDFSMMYSEASAVAIGISRDCGNYEEAVKWCDYRYGDEGSTLMIFGIEGDTYTVEEREDGIHYIYTDKIENHEGCNSVAEALYKYMLPCNHPGLNQHPDYLFGYYPYEAQKEAIVTWNLSSEAAKRHFIPVLTFSKDELEEKTDIQEVAEPALEAALTEIMLGKASMDAYDAAIEQAKANGYDRWIEITQTSYDRYSAKK